jgi:DNA-binding transcriptional regulator YiaG
MVLDDVVVMIPFCRTVNELLLVYETMNEYSLKRGENGLEVYLMAEVPSNVILAEQFADYVDGFSIGSNDLTQFVLGLDHDSSLVAGLFNERNDTPVRRFLPSRKTVRKPNAPQYSEDPRTLGEHIRKKRIERTMLQKELAALLGVTEDCITGWEKERTEPQVKYYPNIIAFLEYYPFVHETETLAGKLKQIRFCYGLSFRQCAYQFSISEDAAKRWERGKPVAYLQNQQLIETVWHQLPNRLPQHPV